MKRPLVIGITGGVGSGKSLVLQILAEEFGACLLRADDIANEMLAPGGDTWQFYKDRLGDGILRADGTLDRAAVAGRLYADPSFVAEVNAFVHPRVKDRIGRRIAESQNPLILLESALMQEGDLEALCDEIWAVTAPRETRIRRLQASRGYSRERCEEIMDLQKTDDDYAAIASLVIDNAGTPEQVRALVCRLAAERLPGLRKRSGPMYLRALSSGSNGNCISVGDSQTHLLIDAGISCRRITAALAEDGLAPDDITAVFLTHEHADHVIGVKVLASRFHLPVFGTEGTLRALRMNDRDGHLAKTELIPVKADREIVIGDLTVRPFAVTHDAAEPVAYRIENGVRAAAVCTDLGRYTDYIARNLADVNVLLLESNHDVRMLQAGPYPYALKRRILSDYGHLCNEAAGQLLAQIWHPGLTDVLLGHISQENNLPDLAGLAVSAEIGAAGIPADSAPRIHVIPHGGSSALIRF